MSRPQRYRFLDLYRGLVVLLMLEGHVLRALLTQEAQSTPLFIFHEMVHGVTGPGFLFGAGFAFAIATQRRWESLITFSPALLRRIWRLILIIAVGYILHIPFFSLYKTFTESSQTELIALFSFGVLQSIGVTLLALRLLLALLRSEKVFIQVIVVLMLAIVYVTPFVWNPSFGSTLPLAVQMSLNGLKDSPYPLFPYAGFVFAGTIVAWQYLRKARDGMEGTFIRNLALGGIILVAAGFILDLLPYQTYPHYEPATHLALVKSFWYTSPNFFWIRLGVLFLLMSGLWFFENLVQHRDDSDVWMPQWLIVLGVESFAVYVAHLFLLYGWVIPYSSLTMLWGLKLHLSESLVIFLLLALAMVIVSTVWRYMKKQHPVIMQAVYWYAGTVFLYYFITNPY